MLVAREIGAVLAEICSYKFASAGFLDRPRLEIARPMHLDGAIFRSMIQGDLAGGRAAERLGRELSKELRRFVTAASKILDDLDEVPCLVHGDFDGSNILVARVGDQWRVSGVVDWEYAIAATPLVDLGKILRPPFGDDESFRTQSGRRDSEPRRRSRGRVEAVGAGCSISSTGSASSTAPLRLRK